VSQHVVEELKQKPDDAGHMYLHIISLKNYMTADIEDRV